MIEVYVLDVPEFLPLVETSRGSDEITISGPVKGRTSVPPRTS